MKKNRQISSDIHTHSHITAARFFSIYFQIETKYEIWTLGIEFNISDENNKRYEIEWKTGKKFSVSNNMLFAVSILALHAAAIAAVAVHRNSN